MRDDGLQAGVFAGLDETLQAGGFVPVQWDGSEVALETLQYYAEMVWKWKGVEGEGEGRKMGW